MKQIVILAFATVSIAQLCSAAPCTSGTLADYIALGTGGCTIGGNTLSGFQTRSGIVGFPPPTIIAPLSINVSPIGGSYNPGFTASTSMTANAGTLLEAVFTYVISGSTYTSDSSTLANSSESPDGAVTDIQNYCAGGTFGPDGVTGCTGVSGTLVALDGVENQHSAPLNPVSFVSVTDDFTLDGGLAGSATGGSITDQFTAVPEPLSSLFTGLGFAVVLGLKLRSTRHRLTENTTRIL